MVLTEQEQEEIIQKRAIEFALKDDFERSLQERVSRSLEMRSQRAIFMTPPTHFAQPAIECFKLYRDSHFYGCISLTQAVVEALARFICERDGYKTSSSFPDNVSRMKYLDKKTKQMFMEVWGSPKERNDFHHLNPDVERDRKKLGRISKRNITLLSKIENEVFAHKIRDGAFDSFKYPKYWDVNKKNKILVNLRIDV